MSKQIFTKAFVIEVLTHKICKNHEIFKLLETYAHEEIELHSLLRSSLIKKRTYIFTIFKVIIFSPHGIVFKEVNIFRILCIKNIYQEHVELHISRRAWMKIS
jgi:hypothetical protein